MNKKRKKNLRIVFAFSVLLFIVITLFYFQKSSSGFFLKDYDSENSNLIDCGKSKESLFEKGSFSLSRGIKDKIDDPALDCFGNALLSEDCKPATIVVKHHFYHEDELEESRYRYVLFEKNNTCYIKGIYIDSSNPELEIGKERTIACEKNLSIVTKDYKELGISPEDIINTFTDHYLNELHTYLQGAKSVFTKDKTCFYVN